MSAAVALSRCWSHEKSRCTVGRQCSPSRRFRPRQGLTQPARRSHEDPRAVSYEHGDRWPGDASEAPRPGTRRRAAPRGTAGRRHQGVHGAAAGPRLRPRPSTPTTTRPTPPGRSARGRTPSATTLCSRPASTHPAAPRDDACSPTNWRTSPSSPLRMGSRSTLTAPRDDPAEREANAAADAVTSGRRLVPRLVHSPTIACQDMGTPGRGPSPYLGGAPDAPYAPDREPYFGAPEPVPMPGLEPTPGPGAPAASPVRLLGVEVTPSHRGHFAQVPGTGSGTHWVGAWRSRAPGGPCRTPSPGA
jgi:hypothetical protein